MKGRYTYMPAAGKIHRNAPTLKERLRKLLRRKEVPDVFPIIDCYPAVYPQKK